MRKMNEFLIKFCLGRKSTQKKRRRGMPVVTYPIGVSTFVIPDRVSHIQITASGGSGGSSHFGNPGGRGALVQGSLNTSNLQGQTLTIYVGSQGLPSGGTGGTGYETGGDGGLDLNSQFDGGAGGGSSAIVLSGIPLVIASGGGGGGVVKGLNAGGAGGAPGQDGLGSPGYLPGKGGTYLVGGAGGIGSGASGSPGTNFSGGDGAVASFPSMGAGGAGGGGGGLGSGGGGGASAEPREGAGGGGGGNSYFDPSLFAGTVITGGNTQSDGVVTFQFVLTPLLVTSTLATGFLGIPIFDTATLSEGFAPTGTLLFNLVSASDCSLVIFSSLVNVNNGNNVYSSASYIPTVSGSYVWAVTYSGDVNNSPVSIPCQTSDEFVSIGQNLPMLSTTPTPDRTTISTPQLVRDIALLTEGYFPTGTLLFELRSVPSNTLLFTSSVSVAGNGSYSSQSFLPTVVGNYNWVVTYSGDANNLPVQELFEPLVVAKQMVLLELQLCNKEYTLHPCETSHLETIFRSGYRPTGELKFEIRRIKSHGRISRLVSFSSTRRVRPGTIRYTSKRFCYVQRGQYLARVTYSGDQNNESQTTEIRFLVETHFC